MEPALGTILTWNIRGVMITLDRMTNELRAVELSDKVRKIQPVTFLRRALKQADEDGLIRKLGDEGEFVSYASVSETRSFSERKWEGAQTAAITLNKLTGELIFSEETEFADDVRRALKSTEGMLLSWDVSNEIRRVLITDAHAVSLRKRGGVFFVPASHSHILDKLDTALSMACNSSGSIYLNRMEVAAGTRTVSDIERMYGEAVMEEIARMKGEVRAMMGDLMKARPSTFTRKAKRMKELRKQVALYSTTLGANLSAVAAAAVAAGKSFDRVAALCIMARSKARESGV